MTTVRDPNFLPHMWVYTTPVPELFDRIGKYLKKLGYHPVRKVGNKSMENYLYAKGELPVLLVAHLDTVHEKLPTPRDIVIKDGTASAPGVGLGADDRAGVAGILELLKQGFRPHVLLTDGEESGGIGAKFVVKDMEAPSCLFAIELDRRGANDCVFYQCDNPKFEEYCESFGFKFAWGSYTDISTICPAWGFAGVNLSIGYYNAHTEKELLRIEEWWKTIDRVAEMLKKLPEEKFEYIPRKVYYYYPSGYMYSRLYSEYGEDLSAFTEFAWRAKDAVSQGYDLGEIAVRVTPKDMAYVFGGTPGMYREIIEKYKDVIEGYAEDFIYNLVIELMEQEAAAQEKEIIEKAFGPSSGEEEEEDDKTQSMVAD